MAVPLTASLHVARSALDQLNARAAETAMGVAPHQTSLRAPRVIDLGTVVRPTEADGVSLDAAGVRLLAALDTANAAGTEAVENVDAHAGARAVVLYGFGRIGRCVARLLAKQSGAGGSGTRLVLRAVVVRPPRGITRKQDLHKRLSLMMLDSVHGAFHGSISVDEAREALVINGLLVRFIYAPQPEDVDYKALGIDRPIVVDNTGVWRDAKGLARHLTTGAERVLLTAPGKGVPNIIAGINEELVLRETTVLASGSCTTNAIVPPLTVIGEKYGIVRGHVETIHSYTNDQNLVDNFHKKSRRGRAAALNMVLTETGAVKAVANIIPELAGKLTGNAIRVPTPAVSIAILSLTLERSAESVEELNNFLRGCAMDGPYKKQIGFSTRAEAVSSDFIGNPHACVIDSFSTVVADGTHVRLYIWYDNEAGFSSAVIRLLSSLSFLSPPTGRKGGGEK